MKRNRSTTTYNEAVSCLRPALALTIRLTPDESRDLQGRAIVGDQNARDQLAIAGLRYAVKLAWKFHRSSGIDAEECVSVATLAAVRAAHFFDPDRSSLLYFVHVCVKHELLARWRRERRPTESLDDLRHDPPGADGRRGHEQSAAQMDADAALATLPPRLRQIVEWTHLDELSGQAIGARLGLTRERIRQLRDKADALLRVALDPERADVSPPKRRKNREPSIPCRAA